MALQIAPLIVPKQRILITLYLFMAGIILFQFMAAIWHVGNYLNCLLRGSLQLSIAAIHDGLAWSVAPSITVGLHVLYHPAD